MDKSEDSPVDIPPASREDESLLMGLAGLEVDALHAGRLEMDSSPPRRAAIPLAGPAQSQARVELAAARPAPAPAPATQVAQAPPRPAPAQQDAAQPVVKPGDHTSQEGQYRSDRPRRGAGFAWPKEVLELVQAAPAEATDETRPAEKAPPIADSSQPDRILTGKAEPSALPLGRPGTRRHTRPAVRHDIDLLIQLACIAAGAWASVLLAWLLL